MEIIKEFILDHLVTWDNFERIVSSLVFLFIALFLLRPKIKIAPRIAMWNFDSSNNSDEFLFKIVNKSFFPCYQVKFEAIQLTPYVVDGGTNFRRKNIELRVNELSSIARYNPFDKTKAFYAVLLVTDEDLKKILRDHNTKIMFEVTARHGLSGISRTFSKEYTTLGNLREGQFAFGNSFSIT